MFNRKKQTVDALEIRFHIDAAAYGHHFKIRVNSYRQGLDNAVVNGVFCGVTKAPELTPTLISYIWEQAKAQGYIPISLVGCLEDNIRGEQLQGTHTPFDAADVARQADAMAEAVASYSTHDPKVKARNDLAEQLADTIFPGGFDAAIAALTHLDDMRRQNVANTIALTIANGISRKTPIYEVTHDVLSTYRKYLSPNQVTEFDQSVEFSGRHFSDIKVPAFLRKINAEESVTA